MRLEHNKNFRANAERIVTDLVSKLDSVSVNGQSGSLLDNGLVMWSHECGRVTHLHSNVGLVTFGSLGGFFNTYLLFTRNAIPRYHIRAIGLKILDNLN